MDFTSTVPGLTYATPRLLGMCFLLSRLPSVATKPRVTPSMQYRRQRNSATALFAPKSPFLLRRRGAPSKLSAENNERSKQYNAVPTLADGDYRKPRSLRKTTAWDCLCVRSHRRGP